MSNDELQTPRLRLAQAAQRLGVDIRTVKRWIKKGKLRALKPGKCVQVLESDVLELLSESQVPAERPRAERHAGPRQREAWQKKALQGLE